MLGKQRGDGRRREEGRFSRKARHRSSCGDTEEAPFFQPTFQQSIMIQMRQTQTWRIQIHSRRIQNWRIQTWDDDDKHEDGKVPVTEQDAQE